MKISQKTEEKYLEKVRANGLYLKRLKKSQTPAICLEAVKQNGLALMYVENQTHDICLEAVKQNPLVLTYVKEQTSKICLEAIKEDALVLIDVNHPTEEMMMSSLLGLLQDESFDRRNYRQFYELIKNSTEEIQLIYELLERLRDKNYSYRWIRHQLVIGQLSKRRSPYHVLECLYH